MRYDKQTLIDAATAVRGRAHAPYSGFNVGAAVQDENGTIHTGCNVENSSFPEGICAESSAIGAMVTSGARRIVAIAAVGGKSKPEPCAPCGGCRQRINEFADADTAVIYMNDAGEFEEVGLDALLPASFRL